jgi:hypothetical protein
MDESRLSRRNPLRPLDAVWQRAVLFVTTFWTFLREFSPPWLHCRPPRPCRSPRPRLRARVPGHHAWPLLTASATALACGDLATIRAAAAARKRSFAMAIEPETTDELRIPGTLVARIAGPTQPGALLFRPSYIWIA